MPEEGHPVIQMGFWPGGDRDGNPFVTADTTLRVAEALRGSIIKCYYMEVRRLKRRLTFEGVEAPLQDLERKLYDNIFIPGLRTELTKEEILSTLTQIRETMLYQHNGLFITLVDSLMNKVRLFGLYFASLDIRQDSSVHGKVLEQLSEAGLGLPSEYPAMSSADQEACLTNLSSAIPEDIVIDGMAGETLESIRVIRRIQAMNGEAGAGRYIISQCNSARHLMEVLALFVLAGWDRHSISVDIVPLFETIDDLLRAERIMEELYNLPGYRAHLAQRGNRQTIMLGFSDGTKDGGYLMANFSIYRAKEELTRISRQYGIEVVFFDGRGGPPARGGGKTHKFYASLGRNIANREIQLTVQG